MIEENINILNNDNDNDIEKAFSTISEAFLLNQIPQDIFEKAQKVYKDNAENRKLKRVGKPWGKERQEEGKQEPPKIEEKPLEQHAKEASEADLQRTIKESGDEKLRQAAHVELERRQKEEAPQEEEKKEPPSGEKPEADTKKEPDTAGKDSGSSGVSKEEGKSILNSDKDLLGDNKSDFMLTFEQYFDKEKPNLPENGKYAEQQVKERYKIIIDKALNPEYIFGKKLSKTFLDVVSEGRISLKDVQKIIESADIKVPDFITNKEK